MPFLPTHVFSLRTVLSGLRGAAGKLRKAIVNRALAKVPRNRVIHCMINTHQL